MQDKADLDGERSFQTWKKRWYMRIIWTRGSRRTSRLMAPVTSSPRAEGFWARRRAMYFPPQ